jgi:membrane-associated protein
MPEQPHDIDPQRRAAEHRQPHRKAMYVVTTLIDALVGLPPWLVLILVFAIPAAEAGLLIGVFVPGETAVLLGGVVAHGGGLPLWTVIVAAALGAVAGDQVGFLLGTSLRQPARGPPPRPGVPLRRSRTRIGPHPAARGDGSSARAVGGRPARAGPGAAGTSGMTRVRFTVANVLGGTLWATAIAGRRLPGRRVLPHPRTQPGHRRRHPRGRHHRLGRRMVGPCPAPRFAGTHRPLAR